MDLFIVVETDNFGGDYPAERALATMDWKGESKPLLLWPDEAKRVADALNVGEGGEAARYWQVRPEGSKLQPGFEP